MVTGGERPTSSVATVRNASHGRSSPLRRAPPPAPAAPENWPPQVGAQGCCCCLTHRGPSGQERSWRDDTVAHQAACPGRGLLSCQAGQCGSALPRELGECGGLATRPGPAVGEAVVGALPGLLLQHTRIGESEPGGQVRRSWSGTAEVVSPACARSPTAAQGSRACERRSGQPPSPGQAAPHRPGCSPSPPSHGAPLQVGWMTCIGPASLLNPVQSGGLGAWSDDTSISQRSGCGLPSHRPLQRPHLHCLGHGPSMPPPPPPGLGHSPSCPEWPWPHLLPGLPHVIPPSSGSTEGTVHSDTCGGFRSLCGS